MRVLLFGASGFIGRHALTSLAAADADVIVAGRREPSGAGSAKPDFVGWAKHDLVTDSVEALLAMLTEQRPEVVVNCAGLLGGSATELVEANVTAVARLIDTCASLGIRLVTLGSAAEYGVVAHGVPVAEDAPCRPVGAYGVTRMAATELLRLAVAEERLDGVALRVFNPIGAGMPAGSVLDRVLKQVDSGTIKIGPLDAFRDFVDVRDVGAAIASAALASSLPESVLNLGSGQAVATRELVRMVCAEAGFSGQIIEDEAPPARSAGVDWIAADLTRITAALGWRPSHALEATVKEVVQG